MANDEIFDPLAIPIASEGTTDKPHDIFIPANTEATVDTKSQSVLLEFDPLAQEENTERQHTSHPVNQPSSTPIQSNRSPFVLTSESFPSHEGPSSVTSSHAGGLYVPASGFGVGLTKSLNSVHKQEMSKLRKVVAKDKADSGSTSIGASSQSKSDQIGEEILQIDSVLKALNMGQFGISSLTGTPTVQSQKSQSNQTKQAMPAAAHSAGLQLISQLGSGDSGSSSESEDSSSDSSEDSVELSRELHNVNDSNSDGELESTSSKKIGRQSFPISKGEVDYRTSTHDVYPARATAKNTYITEGISALPSHERCDIPFPDKGTVMPMGKVSHLAEKLVVIQALPGTPPFDEGTVIWSKEKKSIARIFETFGPVKSPVYSVLVESKECATSLGLTPGQLVYVVPSDMELTRYVFTQQLMKQKGSDASWKDDHEVPSQFQDYSDDESEHAAKKGKKYSGKRARQAVAGATLQPSPNNLVTNDSPCQDHSLYPTNTPAVSRPPINLGYNYQRGHSMSAYPSSSQRSYSDYHPPPY